MDKLKSLSSEQKKKESVQKSLPSPFDKYSEGDHLKEQKTMHTTLRLVHIL